MLITNTILTAEPRWMRQDRTMRTRRRRLATTAGIYLAIQVLATEALAQDQDRCRFLCPPQIEVTPSITINNLLFPPRVAELPDGIPERLTRESEFEFVLSADIPTRLSRLGFTIEAHWTPWSSTDVNPFTGRTADDLGASAIRDNPVELEFETNIGLITEEQTNRWFEVHFDVVDNFSPAHARRIEAAIRTSWTSSSIRRYRCSIGCRRIGTGSETSTSRARLITWQPDCRKQATR